MMMKVVYKVVGTTKGKDLRYTYEFPTMKQAIEHFIDIAPRFRGNGEVRRISKHSIGEGMWIYKGGDVEVMDSFTSTKELKSYMGE